MLHPFSSQQARLVALPRFIRLAALAIGMTSVLPSCVNEDGTIPNPFNPARVTVAEARVHPEGVQFDELNQRFLVSSRTQGRIGAVQDNGTYRVFADDPRLISTIGLNLDVPRQRLLAAVSDGGGNTSRSTPATLRQLAGLAIFNSNNGSLQRYVNLGALRPGQQHFANDIAVDLQGNAYVTDSFSPIIYKVDLQGNASVFLENPQLSGGTGFGLNGIVFHPGEGGFLLVAKANDGTLFKVPISNPQSFTTVSKTQSLIGADGLLLLTPETLLVVSGSQQTVFRMNSTDTWASARATGRFATGAVGPTTITRRSLTDAYVLYPYQASSPFFEIVKVNFM
jgi:sugar lactone lactonase YvrE